MYGGILLVKEFFKSRGFYALATAAGLLLAPVLYAAFAGGVSLFPQKVLSVAFTPLQTAVGGTAKEVGEAVTSLFGGGALRRENEALREEIAALRAGQVELDSLRRQNEWYHEFLELKAHHPDYRFAQARVIARDPADGFGNFTVNCGSAGGVTKGNPVITADGLVGTVYEVFPTSAKVRTVLDPQSPISVYVSRTRDHGITAPTAAFSSEGLLRIARLERTAKVRRGDVVVTFGSASCPEGLLVGELTTVYAASDGLSLSGTVRPFADVFQVIDVMVMVDFDQTAKE